MLACLGWVSCPSVLRCVCVCVCVCVCEDARGPLPPPQLSVHPCVLYPSLCPPTAGITAWANTALTELQSCQCPDAHAPSLPPPPFPVNYTHTQKDRTPAHTAATFICCLRSLSPSDVLNRDGSPLRSLRSPYVSVGVSVPVLCGLCACVCEVRCGLGAIWK